MGRNSIRRMHASIDRYNGNPINGRGPVFDRPRDEHETILEDDASCGIHLSATLDLDSDEAPFRRHRARTEEHAQYQRYPAHGPPPDTQRTTQS
jgi:hypothetical protein